MYYSAIFTAKDLRGLRPAEKLIFILQLAEKCNF